MIPLLCLELCFLIIAFLMLADTSLGFTTVKKKLETISSLLCNKTIHHVSKQVLFFILFEELI